MALRKIVTVGDPILTKVCRPVTRFDQKLAILIEDMIETMHNANGVGLAGPQVGVMRRLCVVDTGEEDVELVNPEVVEVSEETQTGVEGCLSLPGKYGIVTRPEHVVVRAQDRNGDWYEYEGEDIVARCFLHEIDHLDGHMYTEIAERMLTPEELEEKEKEIQEMTEERLREKLVQDFDYIQEYRRKAFYLPLDQRRTLLKYLDLVTDALLQYAEIEDE